MTAMLLAVLSASLLGSPHCAGMCGPFCGVAVGAGRAASRPLALHAAYHGGRLVAYLSLGAAAGAAGALLNLAATLAGLQPLALALAGGVMVLIGLAELARLRGVRIVRKRSITPASGPLTRLLQRGHRFAAARSGVERALAIGLLTTLLPCGWLYAFVVTAAGAGGALPGAAVMSAFWLGTLPVLVAVGVGVRRVAGPLAARLPMATAMALILVGLVTLSGRCSLAPAALAAQVTAEADAAVPDASELPPCCRPDGKGE